MLKFTAQISAERSLSHWGLFKVPAARVFGEIEDLGPIPMRQEYHSLIRVGERRIISAVPYGTTAREREAFDNAAMAHAFGIDIETISFC